MQIYTEKQTQDYRSDRLPVINKLVVKLEIEESQGITYCNSTDS